MKREEKQKPNISVFSYKYFARARLSFLISIPSIMVMVVPAVFADISATIFQAINFTAYKIPKVKRSKYIVIDRHHLSYLNFMEKIFCIFCGYVNGVIQYVSEIGARTEEFWCPIKHNKKLEYEHSRYENYLEYGDSTEYHAKRRNIRINLQKELKED